MTDFHQRKQLLVYQPRHREEQAGLTFPGLYGMMANYYLEKYHYTEENLAYVSVKNHFHGSLNSKAHLEKSVKDV